MHISTHTTYFTDEHKAKDLAYQLWIENAEDEPEDRFYYSPKPAGKYWIVKVYDHDGYYLGNL